MKLETSRFGEVDVDDTDVLTFTQPIIGFQEFRRFVRVPGPEGSSITWLQSTESGDLAFMLLDPREVMDDYSIRLSQSEFAELAINDLAELEVFTIVVAPRDPKQVRTNLKAPILINPRLRLGKQTILEKCDYPVQYYLAKAPARERTEIGNARTNA